MNKKLLGTIAVTLVLLFGCNKEEKAVEQVEDEQKPAESSEPNDVGENSASTIKAPLTGVPVDEEVTQRAIAVTINNHPQARPQSGISSADVVYELLVESDATRFLAIYQSELPEQIGPVRSARDYFIHLAQGLDSFYVAHGYSPGALQLLNSGTVDHINGMKYDGTYFKRSSARKAPHNSYISSANLQAAAEKIGIDLTLHKKTEFAFYDSIEDVKSGTKATTIQMNYYSPKSSSSSTYEFDTEKNVYLKSYGSKAMVDELTNTQVAAANVLFFEAPHRTIDSEGRREITLTEGGKAYVFQAGVMREVSWKNKNGLLIAVEADGSDVLLLPGKTWVHLVPTSPGLTTSVLYSE